MGERFFIDAVRHYRDHLQDPELKKAATAFIGQEAMHGREHDDYNAKMFERLPSAEVFEKRVKTLLVSRYTSPPAWRAGCRRRRSRRHHTPTQARLAHRRARPQQPTRSTRSPTSTTPARARAAGGADPQTSRAARARRAHRARAVDLSELSHGPGGGGIVGVCSSLPKLRVCDIKQGVSGVARPQGRISHRLHGYPTYVGTLAAPRPIPWPIPRPIHLSRGRFSTLVRSNQREVWPLT